MSATRLAPVCYIFNRMEPLPAAEIDLKRIYISAEKIRMNHELFAVSLHNARSNASSSQVSSISDYSPLKDKLQLNRMI